MGPVAESQRGVLAAALLACLVAASGCGGSDGTQPSQLKALLVPAGTFPVKVERTFEWDNPTDFAAEGLSLPAGTDPSEAVEAIDEAGFEAGFGRLLAPPGGNPEAFSEVVKFESDRGARTALDYVHGQNLRRQCPIEACAVISRPLIVGGLPDVKGAHHGPPAGTPPPPGSGKPFERYIVQFTFGPHLFIAKTTGPPGLVPPRLFHQAVNSFYEHARRRSR